MAETSPVGLTKDVGWEIGVSRTVPVALEDVWRVLTSGDGVAAWLGDVELPGGTGEGYRTADGAEGELRSLRPQDRIRLTYQPPGRSGRPTTLQVAVTPGRGRAPGTVLRFHQEHLADAEERTAMKAHWADVLDKLESLLASPG